MIKEIDFGQNDVNIGVLNSELVDQNQLEILEKADILLINDKYLSKIVLTFFGHDQLPNRLINLDMTERYSSIQKRLDFLQTKNKNAEIYCHFLLEKETTNYKALVKMKKIIEESGT